MKMLLLILAISLVFPARLNGQKINLKTKNESLRKVMKSIRKQTGHEFSFSEGLAKSFPPITLDQQNATLEQVLDTIFKDPRYRYSIDKRTINIMFSDHQASPVDEEINYIPRLIDLQGTVLDSVEQPIPAASVQVRNKIDKKTMTDVNGKFFLKGIQDTGVLIVSCVGHYTKEFSYTEAVLAPFHLPSKSDQLDTSVVKGYYNTSKALNTGSVGTLSAADIAKQPVSDILMALQGRIAGLYISQKSGNAGADMNFNIRGLNSLENGNIAFIVVDNVPYDNRTSSQLSIGGNYLSPLANLRPDNIESISVLRDADATAIYGSRGANGVLVITTKQAKPGKTSLNINVYSGFGRVSNFLQLMNTQQYLEMRREALKNDHTSAGTSDYDVNGSWDSTRYTDWQKVLIGQSSKVTNATATLSGGSNQTQFLMGVGYREETSVFGDDFKNKIGSVKINLHHESENKKFNVRFSSNYAQNSNRAPQTDLTNSIFMAPDAPETETNGKLNWANGSFSNPKGLLLQQTTAIYENLMGNLNLSYALFPGLQLKSSLGYNNSALNEVAITPMSSFAPSTDNNSALRENNTAENNIKSWILEPQITYGKTLGNHHLESLLGLSFQKSMQQKSLITSSGFTSDALINNPGTATTFSYYLYNNRYSYKSIFARLAYNFRQKYILNLTGRKDGSSRFGPGNHYGKFWAIGAAWLFGEEPFIKNRFRFLDFGKIRGSFGKTGNDQISDNQFKDTYSTVPGYFGTTGLTPTQLANGRFAWETINKLEIGIELGFLKNTINVDASVYTNKTKKQLLKSSLPASTGFEYMIANFPATVENRGFEVLVNTININHGHFKWISSLNITLPENKLLRFPNLASSPYAKKYAVGSPLTIKYLNSYDEVNANTGLYTFKDTGKKPVFIGQSGYGGLSNTFSYKGLSLDLFLQFVKQTGYNFRNVGVPGSFLISGSNQPVSVIDRWKNPGDKASFQRYSASDANVRNANMQQDQSDVHIEDASFIRLKNASLSWVLPEEWTNHLKIQNVRIYMQAQNLLTWTKFKGMDPETQKFGVLPSLPPLRVLTAGIQVTL